MKKQDNHFPLFEEEDLEAWRKEWIGMPEFVQIDLKSVAAVKVHFESVEDLEAFAELIGQRILPTTRSIWYPETKEIKVVDKLRYIQRKD